ncbi:ribonuclease H-like domain-containing protein, partial [Tanacetum coccineum]
PVVKPATICTVISLAVSRKWLIHQLNVKNAFLNENLSEKVYMHQPPGYVDSWYPHHVCLLKISLYGLKQAPRAWFQRFAGYATRAGFYHSRCDSSLFILRKGSQVSYLLIYIDDIILTASSTTLLQQIIASLHRDNLLSWSSKRQQTLSCSTVEAEYRGVANIVAETAWLCGLLHELNSLLFTITIVYCDNMSAIYMSANPVEHQRTKHIKIEIHFIRDMVTTGQMMYFDKGVDRTKLMTEKCIWFTLCGVEKVLTLPEFAVLLGLYEKDELNHGLFGIHFTRLEVDDKLFNHEVFWQKIGKPTSTNPRTSLIKEPLMRIVHKLLVGYLVHRAGSKERCQKRDMWIMSTLEELRGINLAWVIAEHLCKHAPGLKENSLICGGHYVTKISHLLGYLNEEEVAKCSKPIEYETWTIKILANELDEGTHTLMKTEHEAPQPGQKIWQRQEPRGLDSSWGDWNASLNEIKRRDVWRDSMLMRNNYILEHCAPIHHLADQSKFAYPAYEPPNVPPYPYPYVPYPHPYMHYLDTGSLSFGGDHYGVHGDGYQAGSIVPSLSDEIGGLSVGFHGEEFDPIVHLEDCVESDDYEM